MAIADFLPLMIDTIQLAPFTGRNDYGKPTYGAQTPYRSRVVYESHNVRTSDGNEVVARGRVWIAGTPAITAEDQLTLPDATTPPVLVIEKYPDTVGMHHVKVSFG